MGGVDTLLNEKVESKNNSFREELNEWIIQSINK